MQERVLEILICLIYEFNTTADSAPKKWGDISEKLMKNGYTEHEINLAFSWLFDRLHERNNHRNNHRNDQRVQSSGVPCKGMRILHESERMVFRPEAYGYLIYLKELGLIDQEQMEIVIERAMMLGINDVDREDVKAIVASLIFEANGMNSWSPDFISPFT